MKVSWGPQYSCFYCFHVRNSISDRTSDTECRTP